MAKAHPTQDLSGRRFGFWTVESFAGYDKQDLWWCRCDCGTRKKVRGYTLRAGTSTACRCAGRLGNLVKRSEYRIWSSMKQRCLNKKAAGFDRYGGRGVRICARWRGKHGFMAFYQDIGPRPSMSHTIDRINNDGNYSCGKCDECRERGEPVNCRWATKLEQYENRRRPVNALTVVFRGEEVTYKELAKRFGIDYRRLRDRLDRFGWDVESAVTEPIRPIHGTRGPYKRFRKLAARQPPA